MLTTAYNMQPGTISFKTIALFCLPLFYITACTSSKQENEKDALFELLDSTQTGIGFANMVTDSKEMNILNYHNFYNGGGVAIGDIDHDGKPDIFFTSNQGENKLYLNKGNLKFEDISVKANIISKHKWHTGVSMVDINGDGWLDIYVCNAGIIAGDDRSNELYINQKNGTFKEEAHAYGLDDKGSSTQAIFFDYDHDGDLDCFVLNNSPKSVDNFGYRSNARLERDPVNGDRLYRNDGNTFTDVSIAAGIYTPEIAFGLGVTVGDINNDGWEDLYVANDFFERDYLYINQHNGTFKDVISTAMGHISNGAMGTDMADVNNDGYLDVFTAEMLPENNYRLKTTIRFDNYDVSNARNQLDFHHQFTCNTLQLNNQDGTFSEIAQLAGVDATGWSWGTLSFDFDNDGWKDIFVCNGIRKDLTNQDFLAYFNSQEMISKMKQGAFNFMDFIDKMPSVPIPNFAFKNQQNLLFADQSKQLGFGKPSFSSGAAYADLDGDGDLDLVINNENSEAFIYKNRTTETLHHHYLKVKLDGAAPNTMGYGARVTLFAGKQEQVLEQMPTRGFQSSVDPVLLFGLKDIIKIDSVIVQWPNAKIQVIKNVAVDTLLVADQKNAIENKTPLSVQPTWYEDISASIVSGNTKHKENEFVDFNVERLIPRMVSTEGPKLAVGDVNGDGLEDLYMGSAAGDTAKIFLQKSNGHFEEKTQKVFTADAYYENIGAAFFDADGDGDLDLVVASGGNEAKPGSAYLLTRLYVNDGKGNFSYPSKGWPSVSLNASCVRVADFNSDGKPDIFIGGRDIPGSYGMKASSVLLQNNGGGSFTDVTKSIAPGLEQIGMVTDAQWEDIDGDGKKELIIVGDWMPVTVFQYSNGKLTKKQELPHSSGWWNCVTIADLNGDGKPDLIAGNFGSNSNIKADADHPARLYVDDFDNNGQSECIPVYYKPDGKAYPYYLKDEMESQLPGLKKKFLRYDVYAGKSIEEILTGEQIKKATVLTVEQTQTSVFINDGHGNFTMQALPVMAQLSPVFGITAADLNGDGKKDIFMGGNFYGLKPQTGRFDAGYGTTLINDGQHFTYHKPAETGLFIKGEARDVAEVKLANGDRCIVVSMNNDKLYFFKKRK
ncbi:MAG: VCBS repeat-containing protein [Bacteroidota bacterium]